MAYTWAPLPPGERIAVRYPDGFKRTDDQGNELYLVLEANLYGMPNVPHGWSKHRDSFIRTRFNSTVDGVTWRCYQSRMDPCLFVIDRYDHNTQDKVPLPRESAPVTQDRTLDESTQGVQDSLVNIAFIDTIPHMIHYALW